MSTQRTMRSQNGPAWRPGKGPNGRAFCRWCGVEVPKGRRTMCSEECVHELRLRRDPGYLRWAVFQRDRGVCANCGRDCLALERELWGRGVDGRERYRRLRELGIPIHRVSFWDADHIVPVIEGGGECELDNIRTLCVPCHQRATADLAAKRAAERRSTAPKTVTSGPVQLRLTNRAGEFPQCSRDLGW